MAIKKLGKKKKTTNRRNKPHAGEPARTILDAESISITITGPAPAVRHALSVLRFVEQEWNQTIARRIALEKTLRPDADLDDELGGPKLGMEAPTVRDLYIGRCVDAAGRRGHTVDDPSKLPADVDTTVMEVGDALFTYASP